MQTGLGRTAAVLVVLFVAAVPVIAWAVEVGVALTASHLFGFGIIGLAAVVLARDRRWPRFDLVSAAIAAFAAVAAITTALTMAEPAIVYGDLSSHERATRQLAGLLFAVSLFASLRLLLVRFGLARLALQAHYWTTVCVAVLVLAQYAAALWSPESSLAVFPVHNSTLGEARTLAWGANRYGFPRVALTLVEPSILACYLLTGWAYGLFAWRWEGSRRPTTWHLLTTVVLGVAIIVTGSRLAYVVFGATAMGAVALRRPRLARAGLVAASVAVATLLIGPRQVVRVSASIAPAETAPPAGITAQAERVAPPAAAAGSLLDRVEDMLLDRGRHEDDSTRQRVASLVVALQTVRQHPWLGVGYGTSDFYMDLLWPADFADLYRPYGVPPTMMSSYAAIVTETGLLGASCVTLLAVGVILTLWRHGRRGPEARARASGLAAALGTYALGAAAAPLVVYQFLLIWLLLALAAAIDDGTASGASPPSS